MRNWIILGLMGLVAFIISVSMIGCATLSLKLPTTQSLTRTAIQTTGYAIGKNNPELAKEFIKYTQVDREDILVLYESWKRYLAYRLADDDFLWMVERMLSLVDAGLAFKPDVEREAIIRRVFGEFIAGLRGGMDAPNPER